MMLLILMKRIKEERDAPGLGVRAAGVNRPMLEPGG
jgi:hypothetical protein